MSLEKKIDFVALVSVCNANPNGDPLNGNRPRTDYDEIGEITDVCIKRKIRNRMMDLGESVFVQSDDKANDGFDSLSARAKSFNIGTGKKEENRDEAAKRACTQWLDVRSFGQVFSFKKAEDSDGVSIGVRGPVSVQIARSVDPVDIASVQITKSVNNDKGETKGKDTMGMKHFVRFGLYIIKGSINPTIAEKTGFSLDDADKIKKCLSTLFVNDSSAARPDGSMVVNKLYWFKHNCKDGQYSSYRVHNSIKISKVDGVQIPKAFTDYVVIREDLPGLECEEVEGK